MKFPPFRIPHSAFTLLEILVTVALFSILALLLFSIVQSATILWRENERRVDSFREARAALNVMSSDLRGLFSRIDPADDARTLPMLYCINSTAGPNGTASAAGVDSLPGSVKPGSSAMFFFTSLGSKAQIEGQNLSDICQVGYFLAYSNDGTDASSAQNFGSYKIFRHLRSSTPTFQTALEPWLASGSTADRIFTGIGPDINTGPAVNEPLAFYVADFIVSPLDSGSSGLPQAATPRGSGRLQGSFEPDMVEITLVVTNTDLGRRLRTRPEWDNAADLADFKQNSRVFSTRVPLMKNVLPPQ